MPDLKDQIRTYYETTTEPVDIDAITVDPGAVLVGPFPDAAQRRSAMQTVTPETPPANRLWKGLAAAAAVALIVIVTGVALVLATRGGDEIEPIAPTPTTQAPTTTQAPPPQDEPFTVDEALAVADAYFAALDARDSAALLSAFAADATGKGPFEPTQRDLSELVSSIEEEWAWNVAQGTTYSPIECIGTERPLGVVAVRCRYQESGALHNAVGAPPVPISVSLLVTTEGITNWSSIVGQPDYRTVYGPFNRWMREHHPEDADAAGDPAWTSLEEAERFGALRAEYAQLWAAYLIENGCTFDEEC